MIERFQVDRQIRIRDPNELFLNRPRVIHVRRFSELAAKRFIEDLNLALAAKQTLIPVVINSFGGDVYALLTMLDALKSTKVKIATVVEGKAMSCGAVLFSCGSEGYRFAAPNATLMLHDVASFTEGKAEEMGLATREVLRLNRKLWGIMERNIGCQRGFLWNESQLRGRSDWFLTSQEAMGINLVNKVKVPSFITHVRVESTLDWR